MADGSQALPDRVRHGLPRRAAVIGGGNTAVDVAGSVRRLGGRLIIIYPRRQQDMRAFGDEVAMALDEGVTIRELEMPVAIEAVPGGLSLTLQAMRVVEAPSDAQAKIETEPGKVTTIEVNQVFTAIGAEATAP